MFGLGKIGGYLLAAGGAVLAFLGALFAAKRSGEKEVQQKVENAALKQEVENAKVVNETQHEVATSSDAAKLNELRNDWERK